MVVMSVLAACSPPTGAAVAPFDSPGGRLFLRNCVGCHGARAEGIIGPPLNANGHAQDHTDSELVRAIAEGVQRPDAPVAMPAWGSRLSRQEIRQLVEFIKSLWTEDQRQFQSALTSSR